MYHGTEHAWSPNQRYIFWSEILILYPLFYILGRVKEKFLVPANLPVTPDRRIAQSRLSRNSVQKWHGLLPPLLVNQWQAVHKFRLMILGISTDVKIVRICKKKFHLAVFFHAPIVWHSISSPCLRADFKVVLFFLTDFIINFRGWLKK